MSTNVGSGWASSKVDVAAAGVAAFAAAALVGVSAGGPSWLDSAEFIAAARTLGGVHPPGHPSWISIAALADLLPIGPYSARIVWLSALTSAVACFFCVRLCATLMGRFATTTTGAWWAFTSGLILACSGSLWLIGARAEVYGLALATNLWAIDAALRAGDRAETDGASGPLAETAVAIALGLCNHHYVTIFAVPAVIAACWPALRTNHSRGSLAKAVFCAGFLGFLYISPSLRALADTEMSWGNPASWSGFWAGVSAAHFQRSVTQSSAPIGGNLAVLLGALFHQMGVWPAVVGLIGLGVAALRPSRAWIVAVLAVVGGLGTKSLMAINTHNPDDYGYTALAAAGIAAGVGSFGAMLFRKDGPLQRLGDTRRTRLSLLVLPWLILMALLNAAQLVADPNVNLSHQRSPELFDALQRKSLSPGSLYVSNYVFTGFNEQAFRLAEGRRPDITAIHLSMRTGDTDGGRRFNRWLASKRPELKGLAIAAERTGRAPVGNLLPLAEQFDIFAEHDPDNRIPPFSYGFSGFSHRLLRAGERGLKRDPEWVKQQQKEVWDRLYERLGPVQWIDHTTREVLVWQHSLQAAHALRLGWLELAEAELKRARALAPHDRLLKQLGLRAQGLRDAFAMDDRKGFSKRVRRYHKMRLDELAAPQGDG